MQATTLISRLLHSVNLREILPGCTIRIVLTKANPKTFICAGKNAENLELDFYLKGAF